MARLTGDRYRVTIEYDLSKKFESEDLVEATRFAAACSMHTGKRFVVRRICENGSLLSETPLFGINPSTFDYRRVTPETQLALKAMAHELVSNIDEVVPSLPMEGPER